MATQAIHFSDLLTKKKRGQALSKEEIQFWINGVVDKSIPDYQITALLMAIFCNHLNTEEKSNLTQAMAKSGQFMDYSSFSAKKVDKHSTGGIGDKTSLIIAPIVASLGLLNPMVAGRGLGHTGGTIDKLEAIPGYKTSLTFDEMKQSIEKVGTFICGQTEQLAPADKVIYALRDVTQTVDEISLITASILSKKFAEDLDVMTLDVKCGSGAFMTNYNNAVELGCSLIQTANKGGVNCQGVVTRMDYPLGEWAGNSCEVYECIEAMTPGTELIKVLDKLQFDETLPGYVRIGSDNKPTDIRDLLMFFTFALTLNMYILSGAHPKEGFETIMNNWKSGVVLKKFEEMVAFQGGDLELFKKQNSEIGQELAKPNNPKIFEFKVPAGMKKIKALDGQKIGHMLVALGAGRKIRTDAVIMNVSLQWLVHPNQVLEEGQVIARVYHPDASIYEKINITNHFNGAIEFTSDVNFQDNLPLIYCIITKDSKEEELKALHK